MFYLAFGHIIMSTHTFILCLESQIVNWGSGLRTFLPMNILRKNQVYLGLKSPALEYKAGTATLCAGTLTTAILQELLEHC